MLPISLRRRRLPLLTTMVALGLAAAPAQASAAECVTPPSQPIFAQFGDLNSYFLSPGGSFEGSLTWAKTGSPVLAKPNNPFFLSGAGKTSLRLRGSDSVTSPPLCVDAAHPFMRFTGRALDTQSRLVLEVLWTDKGVAKTDVLEEHPADVYRVWAPSKLVPLGVSLPTGSGEAHQVRLRFKLKDGFGDWLVDDVYIDPYGRG